MTNRPGRFTQEEIKRVLRAAKAFGLPVARIQVGDLTIELPLDDDHITKMSTGHPPGAEPAEVRKPLERL